MNLAIFTNVSKPRIAYTMDFVFRFVLGINITIIKHESSFCAFVGKKINYSGHSVRCHCLNIIPSGLLNEDNIHKIDAKVKKSKNLHHIQLFESEEFDPFSTIFYLISRYEEYLPHDKDQHGRFPASESLMYRAGILHIPIVDQSIEWIRKSLNEFFPSEPEIPAPGYRFSPTYDIDHARAFLWKGWKRSIGAAAKDIVFGKGKQLRQRIKVWLGQMDDPYDKFDDWDEWHQSLSLNPVYFWLIGDYGPHDKNPDFRHQGFRGIIHQVSQSFPVGIHPSYASFLKKEKVREEIQRLESIIGCRVEKNRFHFLRFQLPLSYNILLELGIKEDYSMAFPDTIGFRAGTSHSFPWYDLKEEKATQLIVHPFQVMDVTLKNYLKWDRAQSKEACTKLVDSIRENGGTFTCLWHNSSFDNEWEHWDGFYEWLIAYAQDGSVSKS